ncbi:bifunctional metallophosphatase/5'-nucleotidase [Actinosynnema pretiosum subsp. pretiosum]|uniref:5'-Nucleotidase domain protein n=2 Tax=Actinosynnema TaxID=40566 RepID=C6WDW9_ACTMD|nr:bifunctional metallophosphatase/5'-nucleotidase [Actinosynnema mirum]ACU34114.1 5'-Nucleotidase domain protein [Actinosynnema mirum DSM 43827]AXX27512.1 5'-nucleotidase [Actinosynnema pretiosum subsp. pretiosum]QUF01775.1 bifunctional metallophosphatase/5'-nucleotidase [Actinosynnema pretiosum subsp. pretiosum]
MTWFRRSAALAATAVAGAAVLLAQSPATPAQADGRASGKTVDVRLIGINDLHGNIEPPTGSSGRVTLSDGTTVNAGGAAFNATHIKKLQSEVRNSVIVGQGDLIGASPVVSALFHDEPTVEILNKVGMDATAAGNHEFDEGYRELLRMQHGGCHPVDGCQFSPSYTGAKFKILGANVTLAKSGLPALPPFWVEFRDGVPIGFIGMPLKDVPILVDPNGIKDLKFGDEIAAANKYADLLNWLGVKSIVLLVHQGDNTTGGGPDDCNTVSGGPGRLIAEKVSPKIDAVFSGHSHQQYNCTVTDPAGNPRPFIEGLAFGRELSVVDLKIDKRTRDVVRSATKARNHVVTQDVTPDPKIQAVIDQAKTKAGPIANKQVGTIASDVLRAQNPAGESPLGNLIADSQLAATTGNGAVAALMNPGGVRADLTYAGSPAGEGDGVVTYGEAFTVQPFGNILQTVSLTGAQLKAALEQQWQTVNGAQRQIVLQPSAGLTYSWSASAPQGAKISNLAINGTAVDPAASYRITINSFLQGGGDGFSAFTAGTSVTGGGIDLDAFAGYLATHPNVSAPALDRITTTP